MFRTIFALLFAIWYCIFTLPVYWIQLLIGKKDPYKRDLNCLRMVQWAFRVIYTICGCKITIIGHEKVPKDQAVLYVANHNSYFDIIISYALCPDLTGYIAKDSIEKVPLLNMWMRRLYCLFLKRDDVKQSLKLILAAIENIKKGISMTIFPEGTRGKTAEMEEFKEGSFKIAEKTGCPIVPIAISGTRNIILDHMPRVTPTHVILEYCDPIYPKELSKEDRRQLGKLSQSIIQATMDKNQPLLDEKNGLVPAK